MMAADFLEEHRDCSVLVLYGDAPFVDEETIRGRCGSTGRTDMT